MTLWFFLLGLPAAALALAAVAAPAASGRALVAFPRCRVAGWVLCAVGWFWTAYECDTLGIDTFDGFLKVFPGELWILAVVLTFLTCAWMENLLPVRGLCAVLMLFPAELFPAVRECETTWRLALVVFAYACAIIGMFGMFYPWRLRQAFTWLAERPGRVRADGAALLAVGALFIALGAAAAAGAIR